jgi:hypothetical protein
MKETNGENIMNSQSIAATAIDRFRSCSSQEQIEINESTVYATYESGRYNAFYASEAEAIAHCSENGCEFNGQWYQDRYTAFNSGELFVNSTGNVYVSKDKSPYLDPIADKSVVPVVWKKCD